MIDNQKSITQTLKTKIKEEMLKNNNTEKDVEVEKREISQFRAIYKMKALNQNLLGDFDNDGNYVIEEAVMQELISIPKFIDKMDNDGVLHLLYEYKDGTLFKMICPKPVMINNNSFYCTLVLNEEMEFANGYMTDTISTVVGTFMCEKSQENNLQVLRNKAFNIYKKEEITDDVKKPTDAIDAKYNLNKVTLKQLKQRIEDLDKIYHDKRKQLLNEMQGGSSVLEEFSDVYKNLENYFFKGQKRNRFGALNDLLSLVLDGKQGQALLNNPANRSLIFGLDAEYLASVEAILTNVANQRNVKAAYNSFNAAITKRATPQNVTYEQSTSQSSYYQTESTAQSPEQSKENTTKETYTAQQTVSTTEQEIFKQEEDLQKTFEATQNDETHKIDADKLKAEIERKLEEKRKLEEEKKRIEEEKRKAEQAKIQNNNGGRTM